MADNKTADDEYGVLLYYKYTLIPDLDELFNLYNTNCNSLSLLGRVRLSPNGVNVTIGGKLASLEKHIATMKSNPLFEGTDFKLAACHQPSNDRVAEECGFTSLSIRIVKELVTFGSHPLSNPPEISNVGQHLSAAEFHSVLQNGGQLVEENNPKKLILLDARNLYETRIGKFHTPTVETLDPEIRQYSDLPSWIDNNSEKLKGNCVLMYCTGGIRCEMASAYVRSKGAGFENVFQLYGGIQRYLEQYPDGGFFKGKNFVFDHRVSVGSSDTNVLGSCLLCRSAYDDYTSRSRCSYCRMLVLVCDICREKVYEYVCELCHDNGKRVSLPPSIEKEKSHETSIPTDLQTGVTVHTNQRNGTMSRKLRILCLHGFRQNASGFKGRLASLAKKLKNIAELVFVNAPHELSFVYQPRDQNLDHISVSAEQTSQPPKSCSKKFAWLVDPNFSWKGDVDWKVADGPFDYLQYQQQTQGFDESLEHLKKVYSQEGPFDGILGFSQGAAMAALVCGLRQKLKGEVEFRFVILCSGFAVNMGYEKGSINCPSLHVFGNEKGDDRQITSQTSRDLESLFEEGSRLTIEHEYGHIIPTRSPYIDQMKSFLQRFL
ncbi:Rhodanese-like domain-containing protein 6 [Heracleum sosnowskyi]|uniref:Rhodanese-like domain-containing protein 6 n=1 Tax=Heracleum sosnowskyi TaxID=360622 RepID=A0AAD8HDP0_9APIA|nr:Rhodanese-like domain-containing protein 6 [Heracleum sosnowskyi]